MLELSGFIGIPSPDQTAEMAPVPETYEQMVKRLFKDSGDWNVDVMHAAVGISGEVAEMLLAKNEDNFIEECGDLEFYISALNGLLSQGSVGLIPGDAWGYIPNSIPANETGFLLSYVSIAGDLLDLAKKQWIYNKEPDSKAMQVLLVSLIYLMNKAYHVGGLTREIARAANMAKLQKRYPLGYSDKAAQERADKPAGE